MNKWIAEFELEDGDTMPEHMDLEYKGAKIDFHCRPMWGKQDAESDVPDRNVGDLISRQAAIDAPFKKFDMNTGVTWIPLEHIEQLPSAQPERIKVSVDREMTEEELKELKKKIADSPVVLLPSAQPERTCVNCGRTVNNGGWYADGGTRCPIEEHYALPKDGYCHLWEERNVTDDDYPERREE